MFQKFKKTSPGNPGKCGKIMMEKSGFWKYFFGISWIFSLPLAI
jgi:hypothetical protein